MTGIIEQLLSLKEEKLLKVRKEFFEPILFFDPHGL